MKKLSLVLIYFVQIFSAASSFAQNAVDPTFDPGTGANAFIESTVVQPDGKILVCGMFTSINGVPRNYIARLKSDGSVDPTFIANPNYWTRFMALQPNGKILIGGFFTGVDGASRNRVARLNENGSLDTTFNPGIGCTGRMVPADPTDPFLFAIAVQNDGKIIIGGNFTNYNGVVRNGVARLNSNGSLDSTFNVGDGVNSWVRSILILPNAQILLSGWFENYDNRTHNRMVRLNPDGSADTGFNPWFGYSTSIYSMSRQNDGKIVVGGHSVNTNAPFRQEIVRLLSDGSYDPEFNPGGEGANDKVESVVVEPDGKILIGGYFSAYNGVQRNGLVRLNSDGTLDDPINANPNNWIWTVALQGDGKILICGAFTSLDGIPRGGIGRIQSTGSPPVTTQPPPPQSEPIALEVWLLNQTNFVEAKAISGGPPLSPEWQLVSSADMDGDKKTDLIFQNTKGQIAAWLLDGTTFRVSKVIKKSLARWRVIAANNLNNDARSDILLRDAKGRLAILFFSKTKFKSAAILKKSLTVNTNWHILGFSDFNGDNNPDFLWQDDQGRLVTWYMKNSKFLGSNYLSSAQSLNDWRPIGFEDISGDQQKDILFQNANGQLATWLMTGTNVFSSTELFPGKQMDPRWHFIGVNDLNGDSHNDVIWQYK